ncbi:uncharacterized protein LOC108658388 isoform X2 [Drosophila navojoa]|uniref:uncharacterized protein LOC108658388 isoform X1 n=1 Tax=Drosophila navojoa TaxID=7232 RepID=UPI000847BF30|nr:uncharacterized protein LOC108658388 isoform X1 [Drosophila navojoa]XP_017966550.1 uncharacterized protein LOC108658388 isoform X2 [Drosophila navojoa]
MHVRIAWEIYYHQNKQNSDKPVLAGGSTLGNICSSGNSGTSSVPNNTNSMSSTPAVVLSGNTSAALPTSGTVGGATGSAASVNIKPSPSLTLNSASPHLLHRSTELTTAATYARSPFEASPLAASFIGAPPSHIGTAVSQFSRYVGSFGFAGLSHFGRDISLSGHLDTWR